MAPIPMVSVFSVFPVAPYPGSAAPSVGPVAVSINISAAAPTPISIHPNIIRTWRGWLCIYNISRLCSNNSFASASHFAKCQYRKCEDYYKLFHRSSFNLRILLIIWMYSINMPLARLCIFFHLAFTHYYSQIQLYLPQIF